MFGEWVSVTERLPEKEGKYLVLCDYYEFGLHYYLLEYHNTPESLKYEEDYEGPGFYDYVDDPELWYSKYKVTAVAYWMPLPELPKGE